MKLTRKQLRRLIFEQIKDSVDIDIDTQQAEIPPPPEVDADWGDAEDQWSPHHEPSFISSEIERGENIPSDPYGDANEGYYDEDDFIDDPFNPDSPHSLGINEGWFGKSQQEKDAERIAMLRKKYGSQLSAMKQGLDMDKFRKDPVEAIEASIDDMASDLGYAQDSNDDIDDLEEFPEYMPKTTEEKIKELQRKLQLKKMKRSTGNLFK